MYKNIAETAELRANYLRLNNDLPPEHGAARLILDEVISNNKSINDLSRLERIKAWFKENWVVASALGITIASLLTTIIIGVRSAAVKGAKGAETFAGYVRKAVSKLGPWPWAIPIANFLTRFLKEVL